MYLSTRSILLAAATRGDAYARLQSAANEAATGHNPRAEPSPAQQLRGNYKKGRIEVHGLKLAVESVRNSTRSGTDPGGRRWETRLAAHYGEFTGTLGNDGDPVDAFVGLFPESLSVWVINQRFTRAPVGFDEHKVMLGFTSEQQAIDAYKLSFDRDWQGLMSIAPCSISQLKWWLSHGDKSRPFSIDQLPFEGTAMLDKVLWNQNAEPVSTPIHKLMYDLRVSDKADGLMLDAVTMDDLMGHPDIDETAVLDALVIEVSRMQLKMELLKRVMESAGESVKPTDVTISDPVRARGVLQVMVLFLMNDGQTISVWFHNPDTTPAKLTPMDELISWKWMLNKKDVTIVVAPERGKDLNVREVARRIMRLVERNAEAFKKANTKVAERAAQTEAVKAEIGTLEAELAGLNHKIEVATQVKADTPAPREIPTEIDEPVGGDGAEDAALSAAGVTADDVAGMNFDGGYPAILASDKLRLKWQDVLDAAIQERAVAVLNALRKLGWGGVAGNSQISKNAADITAAFTLVGAGKNAVQVHYMMSGIYKGENIISDDLLLKSNEMASKVDASVSGTAAVEESAAVAQDVNIGREWDSQYGRQKIVSRDDSGTPLYDVNTIGSDTNRRYAVSSIEDVIKKDEYRLTPEYQKELDDRAEINRLQDENAARALVLAEKVDAEIKAFTDSKGMGKLPAARARLALLTQVRSDGVVSTRKSLAESLVGEGRTIGIAGGGRALMGREDNYMTEKSLTKTGMDYAAYLIAKAGGGDASEADPIAAVDAAYKFSSGTDEFKRWIAGSIDASDYSPFLSAKAMDMKAAELGGSIAWDVSGVVLDAVTDADAMAVTDASQAPGAVLDAAGAYMGQEKDAIAATLALLRYFKAFIASDAKFAKVPEGVPNGTSTMDKKQAQVLLRWLIDTAVNRKGGEELTPAQEDRYKDYVHDARYISDYLTKRIRSSGSRNLLRVPELKKAYPEIDNQPRVMDSAEVVEEAALVLDAVSATEAKKQVTTFARQYGLKVSLTGGVVSLQNNKTDWMEVFDNFQKALEFLVKARNDHTDNGKKWVFDSVLDSIMLDADTDPATVLDSTDGSWHTKTMEAMKSKSDSSLRFIIKDATEAADVGEKNDPPNPKSGQYRDEAHYASMEIQRRKKGGKQILDAVEETDIIVGMITLDGKIAGRALVGGDGKSMVYVGTTGTVRVQYKSQVDGEMRDVMWSEDEPGEKIANLASAVQATAEATPEVVPEVAAEVPEVLATAAQAGAALKLLAGFMSASQMNAVKEGMRGEEKQYFISKMVELEALIKGMPKTYDQDGMGDDAVASLHYFKGGADWYITEKDVSGDQEQAYGLADLGNGQGGERGYISIVELIGEGVELDFGFAPQTLKQVTGGDEAAPVESVDSDKLYAEGVEAFDLGVASFKIKGPEESSESPEFAALIEKLYPGGMSVKRSGEMAQAYRNGFAAAKSDTAPVESGMQKQTYDEWERSVTDLVAAKAEVSNGDAQGMVEAQAIIMSSAWAAGSDAEAVAGEVLAAGVVAEPSPAVDPAPVAEADPVSAADTAYLNTLIDGSADMFAADIMDRLEPMFAKYESDVDMMELLSKAAEAYSNAAVGAARAALAG